MHKFLVAFANLGGLRHAEGSLRRTEGGEGGIRTHGPLSGQDAFEAPPL